MSETIRSPFRSASIHSVGVNARTFTEHWTDTGLWAFLCAASVELNGSLFAVFFEHCNEPELCAEVGEITTEG